MSVSCNAEFSDSKVIAVIAKRVLAEKNAPKYSDFGLNAVISRIAHCCFSQKCESFAAVLRPIRSNTADDAQYYCGASAVILRFISRHTIPKKTHAES